MTLDAELLDQYVKEGSDEAFRNIVERYIGPIYSVALRRLGFDAALASDATQEVFIALARHASSIRSAESLPGWLHRQTCFITANIVRSEQRRKRRELTAAQMMTDQHENDGWLEIAPKLDSMINDLPAPDREAVLLRFFSQMDFETIGRTIGITDDAAQKRVHRAVGKLQDQFQKAGVALPAGGLMTLLAAKVVTAAPATLTLTASSAALAGASSAATIATTTTLAISKLKIAIALALIGLSAMVPLTLEHRSNVTLRRQNQSLQSQLRASVNSTQPLPSQNSEAVTAPSISPANSELLQLRGEVAALRAQLKPKVGVPKGIQILSESEFAQHQHSLEPDEVRQLLTFDSLHDCGSASPEATVQTYLWAKRMTMNPATFQTGNERFRQIVYVPEGAKFGGFGKDVKDDPLLDAKILKIEAMTYPTPDTVKVRIASYDDLSGFQRGSDYRLIHIGEEWKLDLSIGRH